MANSLRTFLVSFDVFGEPVSVNYRGETSYKTAVGAFLTICLKSFLFVVAAASFLDLVQYRDPLVS